MGSRPTGREDEDGPDQRHRRGRPSRRRRRRLQRLCERPPRRRHSDRRGRRLVARRRGMSSGSACWEPEPRTAAHGCSANSICTTSPSRTPSTRTSGRSWSNMATRCSSSRAPPSLSAAAFPSARRISSSARATSSASGTAPRRPTPRCASIGRPARRRSPRARISSSTPSSISSSTTTCRCWNRSRRRSTRSRTGCWPSR